MVSIITGPAAPGMHWLAIPAASLLILFLGYSSQWLFRQTTFLDPGPLTPAESAVFNSLLVCLWWTYLRACTVDPGRYVFAEQQTGQTGAAEGLTSHQDGSTAATTAGVPGDHGHARHTPPRRSLSSSSSSSSTPSPSPSPSPRRPLPAALPLSAPASAAAVRWCKKCSAPKPPRAHHCRHCARCIPKMDHHCPWTGNCVSMQTFPHFLRFVVFTNLSLWALAVLLSRRLLALWDQRHLPAYLGPTLPQLIHLTVLFLVCSGTCLALFVMLYSTVRSWLFNLTMIESWEIDRHEAVVDRYNSFGADGGWWDEDDDGAYNDDDGDNDGSARTGRAPCTRVEFPYDLGFFQNMAQAMGTRNVLLWFLPFACHPTVAAGGSGPGWDWPENGFNDRLGMWPPPDPDKERRSGRSSKGHSATVSSRQWGTPEEEKAAFQARQAADFLRRRAVQTPQPPPTQTGMNDDDDDSENDYDQGMDGEPGWTNADGDRLRDYGVDEEAEEDDADVPLAQLLLQRQKAAEATVAQKRKKKL